TSVRDVEFHRETMTAPALSPQHYRCGLEVTIGPIAKVVAALSSDPDRLVKFRAELDALIDKYSSRNLVHQSYLMTRAIKRACTCFVSRPRFSKVTRVVRTLIQARVGQEWAFILRRSFPQKQPLVAAFDA